MSTLKLIGDKLVLSLAGKLTCVCCCPTLLPTVQYDSRSASLTKLGYSEFGTDSSPPKIYHRSDYTGSWTRFGDTITYNGNQIVDAYTGAGTDGGTITTAAGDCAFDQVGDFNPSGAGTDVCGGVSQPIFDENIYTDCARNFNTSAIFAEDIISTTQVDYPGCAEFGTSGTGTITLSDEYLTSELMTNTVASLPAYPGTWSGTPGSYANLTTDELTYSIRESKARIPVAGVGLVSGTEYILHYFLRFTPLVGSVIDTPDTLAFTYNGTDTHLEFGVITIPSSNGTTTIVLDYWECPVE